jgi:hypothetical protein
MMHSQDNINIETSILEAFKSDDSARVQISHTGVKSDPKKGLLNDNVTLILPAERKNSRYVRQKWAGIAQSV